MLVIIGSVALNQYRKDRKPTKDVDAIADYDTAVGFLKSQGCTEVYPINEGKTMFGRNATTIFEIEIAWPNSTGAALIDYLKQSGNRQPLVFNGRGVWIPSLSVLYALKMSHRYLRNSPHFLKTRNDILEMRQMGAQIPDNLQDWYRLREEATYWYQHPNLNRSKQEFFVDLYQYDHDSLHEAVAILKKPAYKYYEVEGKEVASSRDKFFQCTDVERLCGVVEEASVLALERSLIPFPGAKTEAEAFEFALQKVCTSITSGWFREYAYNNYERAIRLNYNLDRSLMMLLADGIAAGIVKEVDVNLSTS